MSAKKVLISLLLVGVLAAIIYAFYDKFEKVTKEIDIGFTGEAYSNSLYASRLFLKKMGIPAEKVEIYRLTDLPSTKTVIVINTTRSTLSAERIEQLLKWVKRGGHLITVVAPKYAETEEDDDILQKRLGIKTEEMRYLDSEFYDDQDEGSDEDYDPTVYVSLKGLKKKYALNFYRIIPIKTNNENDEKLMVKGSVFLVNRAYGDGLISIASDLEFAENNYIEDKDHAEFFWQLLHRKHATLDNVWLLNSDDMPALWDWLWQNAWQLILTLSLLLVFWLYYLSNRFGPIIPAKELNRRRLLEHIQASGYFFWKKNQQDKLIASTRQAVMQKFGKLFPAWHQLTVDEQLQLASEYTEISSDKLRPLLFENRKLSMDEFIHLVQKLEAIRKQ